MRALGIIFFSLLTALLYLSFQNISSYSSSLVFPPRARQSTRKLGVSSPIHINTPQKIEVTEEESKTSTAEENSTTIKHESSYNNIDDVYHTDYHGATTHPTPTPKHPKP